MRGRCYAGALLVVGDGRDRATQPLAGGVEIAREGRCRRRVDDRDDRLRPVGAHRTPTARLLPRRRRSAQELRKLHQPPSPAPAPTPAMTDVDQSITAVGLTTCFWKP